MTPALATREGAETAAEQLRILAHPTRLRILSLLQAGEKSVGDIEIALDLKQPGLSQQLGELRQAGLVSTRRQAKSIFYKIASERHELLLLVIERLVGQGKNDLGALGATPAIVTRRRWPSEAAVFGFAGASAARSR